MRNGYHKICITNRALVQGDFLKRMEEVVKNSDSDTVILREKDLPEEEYCLLAGKIISLCEENGKDCILHTYKNAARKLKCRKIHLTMKDFLQLSAADREWFTCIGVSTHSVEEAVRCEQLGASYITASHIFPTDCKKGLAPRGLKYLETVVQAVEIPVYALGGIHRNNIQLCVDKGAAGVCMMSGYMSGTL